MTTDETWRAEDSPHVVRGELAVVEGATITVEPCSVVRLEAEAGVTVGRPDAAETGRLVARGEPGRPIVFERAGAAPWSALVAHAPSTIELAHARLDGGGVSEAALVAVGGGTLPPAEVLFVDTVEVTGARGHGVVLDRAARFAAGSRGLVLRGNGSGDAARAEPMVVGWHGIAGIPDGAFTGNARDEIVLVDDNAESRPGLQVSTTLRDLGVPYRVGRAAGDDLRIGANGGTPASLTIDEGVELRFFPHARVRVVSDEGRAQGSLIVRGTAARPVVFRGLEPRPGAWAGIYFESPMGDSDVAFARIEGAGGSCGCTLTSCSPLSSYDGAVIFDGLPPRAIVHDSLIVDSAGHGFVRSWVDHAEIDFLQDNEVRGAAGCSQTMPELSGQVCPDDAFACAN